MASSSRSPFPETPILPLPRLLRDNNRPHPPQSENPYFSEETDADSDDKFVIDEDTEERLSQITNTLVGYIPEGRPYRKQAVFEALQTAWNPTHKVDISHLDDRKFLFQFHHSIDRDNVLQEGPWAVSGNLLVLERWNMEYQWSFTQCELWAQLHSVPVELKKKDIMLRLASKLGHISKIMLIDGFQFGDRVAYVRVRVRIDIRKPLRTSISVTRGHGSRSSITIKYERLPIFCYSCRLLGHEETRCTSVFDEFNKHRNAHGCSPHSKCKDLPHTKCNPALRATAPDNRLIQKATIIHIESTNEDSATDRPEVVSGNPSVGEDHRTATSTPRASRGCSTRTSPAVTQPQSLGITSRDVLYSHSAARNMDVSSQSLFHTQVKSNGASGGLALLWNQHLQLEVLFSDDRVIDTEVTSDQGHKFLLTCVYGDPVKCNRQRVWDRLISLGQSRNEQWMCIGDFNSYLAWHEKDGGNRKGLHDMLQFQEVLNQCNLLDMGSNGPPYTWSNKRSGSANILIKLDRALANPAWRIRYANATVFIRPAISSDHNPLLVDTEGGKSSGPKPFRFEKMRLRHPGCQDLVSKIWSTPSYGSAATTLIRKASNCKAALKKWNREEFGHVQTRIKTLKLQLENIQGHPYSVQRQDQENSISKQLEEELAREEVMWHQKARMDWIQSGDKNSAFFHVTTIQRRQRNRILKLKLQNGEWPKTEEDVYVELLHHFSETVASQGTI
ncbi:uncharacterized protein LOC122067070 [Macadamia integrifolia]|uniref:uncharacterized protein LOC122067070 n=1 Tax=Macadamia integrifolia TaxID=60698 RepID=UPI001C4EEF79|nr:uncharacterized protein LOC122067070 [Macadamia integrifolia]